LKKELTSKAQKFSIFLKPFLKEWLIEAIKVKLTGWKDGREGNFPLIREGNWTWVIDSKPSCN